MCVSWTPFISLAQRTCCCSSASCAPPVPPSLQNRCLGQTSLFSDSLPAAHSAFSLCSHRSIPHPPCLSQQNLLQIKGISTGPCVCTTSSSSPPLHRPPTEAVGGHLSILTRLTPLQSEYCSLFFSRALSSLGFGNGSCSGSTPKSLALCPALCRFLQFC